MNEHVWCGKQRIEKQCLRTIPFYKCFISNCGS
jgi:hypothetical protein